MQAKDMKAIEIYSEMIEDNRKGEAKWY